MLASASPLGPVVSAPSALVGGALQRPPPLPPPSVFWCREKPGRACGGVTTRGRADPDVVGVLSCVVSDDPGVGDSAYPGAAAPPPEPPPWCFGVGRSLVVRVGWYKHAGEPILTSWECYRVLGLVIQGLVIQRPGWGLEALSRPIFSLPPHRTPSADGRHY